MGTRRRGECATHGCHEPHYAKGLCKACYMRAWVHAKHPPKPEDPRTYFLDPKPVTLRVVDTTGDGQPVPPPRRRTTCATEGCDRLAYAKKLCATCYQREYHREKTGAAEFGSEAHRARAAEGQRRAYRKKHGLPIGIAQAEEDARRKAKTAAELERRRRFREANPKPREHQKCGVCGAPDHNRLGCPITLAAAPPEPKRKRLDRERKRSARKEPGGVE